MLLLRLIRVNTDDYSNGTSQITLISYNVMFVPSIIVFDRDQITRSKLLTKTNFLHTYDILCLQEVFQKEPSRILLESLSQSYDYRTSVLGTNNEQELWNETLNSHLSSSLSKFVSGGVMILSKWPIQYKLQYFYRNACSAHTFVRTGFVYVKILYNNKYVVHVLGTHLQPTNFRGCYLYGESVIRERQLQEIRQFLNERNISKNELVFLMGDFNIDRYHIKQYRRMLEILNVIEPIYYPNSIQYSWDSAYNLMTWTPNHVNELLDYIFILKDHKSEHWLWYNLITDRLAIEQWHLLGTNSSKIYNNKNVPIMELSDHYPVVGFSNLTLLEWPQEQFGIITIIQFRTKETNESLIINEQRYLTLIRDNNNGTSFLVTNNGTPRRNRCLKSEQYVLLIDANAQNYYLSLISNGRKLKMKYGREYANRYVKIIKMDGQNTSECIESNDIIVFQIRLAIGDYYITTNHQQQLCACTRNITQAKQFILYEIERKNAIKTFLS